MTKKSFNPEEGKPINYSRKQKANHKLEKDSAGDLVDVFRSDMVPASQALPATKKIYHRINLKLGLGIIIAVLILALMIYAIAGAGRPKLERSLLGLINREGLPAQKSIDTQLPEIAASPPPSKTPFPSPTLRPTWTRVAVLPITSSTVPSTETPTRAPTFSTTPTPSCRDVSSITLADVGQILCVQGVVIELIEKPTNFLVIFSTNKGSFYWVTYDLVWSKGVVNACYQITGKIEQIANSPILIFDYSNLPHECP